MTIRKDGRKGERKGKTGYLGVDIEIVGLLPTSPVFHQLNIKQREAYSILEHVLRALNASYTSGGQL